MADPISLTASLVALIHAVRVGGEGLATLRFCYNAPPEIARLRAEVDGLGQLLSDVHNFVNGDSASNTRHPSDIFSSPIELATVRIESINKILASPAFGLSKLSDENRARATLLRYRKRLAILEREIKESVQEIGVRLCLATA